MVQFGKYGLCGILATFVFLTVTTLGRGLFPEAFLESAAAGTQARNLFLLHFAAFLPSNLTAYGLNRWLVFTPGRHSPARELGLFTLISFTSFLCGEVLPLILETQSTVPDLVVDLSFVVSSTLINFVCRKLFVFQR